MIKLHIFWLLKSQRKWRSLHDISKNSLVKSVKKKPDRHGSKDNGKRKIRNNSFKEFYSKKRPHGSSWELGAKREVLFGGVVHNKGENRAYFPGLVS